MYFHHVILFQFHPWLTWQSTTFPKNADSEEDSGIPMDSRVQQVERSQRWISVIELPMNRFEIYTCAIVRWLYLRDTSKERHNNAEATSKKWGNVTSEANLEVISGDENAPQEYNSVFYFLNYTLTTIFFTSRLQFFNNKMRNFKTQHLHIISQSFPR